MTREPLVSIVLPTYNGASAYLDQAVCSCLNQTYLRWELIIVDDASTDYTPVLVARYAGRDSRVRYVRHETNRRLPAALNTGFFVARGDYLTWTSDDNQYRPPALAAMVAFLDSHPSADIVYADYTEIDEASRPTRRVSLGEPEDLVERNCVQACFLYRRAVQDKLGGYDEDLFLAEDYDFWLRASLSFQLHHLREDLYVVRRHANSLTSLYGQQVRLAAEEALSRSLPRMNWISHSTRARGYLTLTASAEARCDVAAARRYLWCAVRRSPKAALKQAPRSLLASVLLGRKNARRLKYFHRRVRGRQ